MSEIQNKFWEIQKVGSMGFNIRVGEFLEKKATISNKLKESPLLWMEDYLTSITLSDAAILQLF